MINWQLFFDVLPKLIMATKTTFVIAIFSTIFGMTGGTFIAMLLKSENRVIRFFANSYVAIFRGTPMIVQIIFIYYLLNLDVSPVFIAILSIGLNSSAYISQIIKSGIDAVEKGQIEAATVLGLSDFEIMRYIVLPQAFKVVLPSLANEFITLVKDSSLAYIIGVNELFKESRNLMNVHYEVITIYLAVALIYFLITFSLSILISQFEKEMKKIC